MGRWIVRSLALLLVLTLLLAGLSALGHWAFEQIRDRPRYTIVFSEIDCTPPPGLSRAEFLEEVQYVASLPDQLPLLEDNLGERLAAAFTRHPWVKQVERVEVSPPRRVRVYLVHRTPALVVKTSSGLRVVDGEGVVLPRKTPVQGLPVYAGKASPPGPAGTRWGDPGVEAAARTARPPGK
jgi:hypothetical protein